MHYVQLSGPKPDFSKVPTHNQTNEQAGQQSWQAPFQYHQLL
jgi:hypothetical protein